MSEKEKSFLSIAYEKSFNKTGFNENIFFRKLFAKFYLLYEDNKLVASASILLGHLDHLYSNEKWKGYGSFLLKKSNPRYIQVIKNRYVTNSLISFYNKFNYKIIKTLNKDYFLLKKAI